MKTFTMVAYAGTAFKSLGGSRSSPWAVVDMDDVDNAIERHTPDGHALADVRVTPLDGSPFAGSFVVQAFYRDRYNGS